MFAENIVTGRQIMAEIHPEKNVLLLREQIYCELRNLAVNSLPGTRLPSENAIAAKFKAARMTVSWAFRKLEEEHLIERRKGCGSFVRGIRTVTYLLPDIAILTSIGANAAVHRECMQGIMHAAKELQLRLETAVINIDNDPQKIDVQQLSTFHSGSMLITMPWFQECFQYLAEHRIRTALISNQNPYYGYKQYTYDWFRLEADRRVAVRKALEMLYGASCRKIAVTNLYLKETHHPVTDTYIEKDAMINDEIDKLRHSATMALFERRDVIVVASVSCIYGLGDPEDYSTLVLSLRPGMQKDRDEVVRKLVEMQYERNDINFVRGKFRVRGDVLEVFPISSGEDAVRIEFFGFLVVTANGGDTRCKSER